MMDIFLVFLPYRGTVNMRCEVVWPKVLSMRAWIGGPVEAVSFIFRSPPKLFLVLTCIAALFLGLLPCDFLSYRLTCLLS